MKIILAITIFLLSNTLHSKEVIKYSEPTAEDKLLLYDAMLKTEMTETITHDGLIWQTVSLESDKDSWIGSNERMYIGRGIRAGLYADTGESGVGVGVWGSIFQVGRADLFLKAGIPRWGVGYGLEVNDDLQIGVSYDIRITDFQLKREMAFELMVSL